MANGQACSPRSRRAHELACALLVPALLSSPNPALAAPPEASVFGSLPALDDVTLSPDGRSLAYSLDQGANGRVVAVIDLTSGETRRTFPTGAKGKLHALTWSDDDTLLVDVSISHHVQGKERAAYQYEMFRTIAVPVPVGEPRMLLMDGGSRGLVTGSTIVAERTPQPKTVLMSTIDYSSARGYWVSRLYAVDVQRGNVQQLESGGESTFDWLADASGRVVARGDRGPDPLVYRVLAKRETGWTEIYRQSKGRPLNLVATTTDGTAVLALGTADGGRAKLWAIPVDGSAARIVVEDPQYDVEDAMLDRFDRHVIAARIGGPTPTVRWLDAEAQAMHARIARAFPGRDVEVYGRSRDDKRVLARVEGPSAPPIYYIVDLAKKTADIVGEAYPALADVPLGVAQVVSYPARDGTTIPAYLTLPPGGAAKDLPLVVLPHGGPAARDDLRFDWFVQFLATRGYAVLQPQFRGSTGFGSDWRTAGQKQWGGLMQDDITDGVKAIVERGIADPKRICIVGLSYGGYSALAGAVQTPELYRCAVSIAGVSDLPVLLGHERISSDDGVGSVYDGKLVERSPARRPESVQAPILLLHGTADSVVPIMQSELMAGALKRAGKPFEFVRLAGGDHWLLNGETRTRVLEETGRFLEQNLR